MTSFCTLTDLVSWFSCAENLHFTEVLTVVLFFTFFLIFKDYPSREGVLASLFIAAFSSFVFLGLGLINPLVPLAYVVLLALSAVFLQSQNSS